MTEAFDGPDSARGLVVGDVMLDRYVWGDVKRISPEARVQVVRARMLLAGPVTCWGGRRRGY